MLNEQVLDALRSINVPEDKARAAAISLTEYEPKLEAVKGQLSDLKVDVADVKGRLAMLQWMIGVNTALLITVLFKLFHV